MKNEKIYNHSKDIENIKTDNESNNVDYISKISVEINSQINEIFAKSIISQKFSNLSQNSIELKIYIFKIPKLIFSSFKAKIGDSKTIKSKIMKKEKTEEKYTDIISSGNAAIFVKDELDKYIINMGNIPPKENIIFISEFIQFTENDKSFQFELSRNLPIFRNESYIYQNTDVTGKVEIQTKNKIINIGKDILMENLRIIEEKYKNEDKNNYIISYKIDKLPEYSENNKDYIPCSKIYFNIDKDKPILYFQKHHLTKINNIMYFNI